MKLPAEIRNKIYEYVFVGKTVHVDTTPAYPQSDEVETENGTVDLYWDVVVPKLRGRLCEETPSRHDRFINLIGPARSQIFDTSADGLTPAQLVHPHLFHTLDNAVCTGVSCTSPTTVLTLQLLRTCKKIHSEVALMPYTSTFFILNDANRPLHHEALRRTFGAANRAAILHAAFHNIGQRLFVNIPELFPKLQRVWLDLDDYPVRGLNRNIAKMSKLAGLKGAAIRVWTDVDGMHKERVVLRMEKAVLGDWEAMKLLMSDS
jgi:hypothetical protein